MTLGGRETAELLERGSDYIELMGGSVAYDYLTAGPLSDVRVNPANPRKIQIIVSSNSEDTQQLDLGRMAEMISGPELSTQLENPVSELQVPWIAMEPDGTVAEAAVHSLELFEAVFTTTDGIDVSLTTLGSPMVTRERRHQPSEAVNRIRDFAKFVGGTALQYEKVNIRLVDPLMIRCHAFAVCKLARDLRRTASAVDSKVLGDWEPADGYSGPDGLTAKATLNNASWEVSIYPGK